MFSRSARFYDALYSFKDYEREGLALRDLVSARVPGARTLLDVACGTGLHLEQLREAYDVSGIDLDPEMLSIAARRNPGVPLAQADMVDFDLERTFDVVTCLFSSVGYARSTDKLVLAAKAMGRHVAPGGVLVVEPWIFPEQFEAGRADAQVVDFDGGKIVRASFSDRRGDESLLELHYLVRDPNGDVSHFSESHSLGLFSHDDYRGALESAGLEVSFDEKGLMGRGLYIALRPR